MTQVIVKSCMCTYASDRSPILLLLDWLTLLVALNVMYEREKSYHDLVGDDDKVATTTHADAAAAAATTDVAVPYS